MALLAHPKVNLAHKYSIQDVTHAIDKARETIEDS
jgi:hypothetical protein